VRKHKVLHLINILSQGSGPLDRATSIDQDRYEVSICAYYGNDGEDLESRTAVQVHTLNAKGRLDLGAWVKVYRVIRQDNIDIVHTHHHLTGLIGRIMNIGSGKPIVHSFGNEFSKFSLAARFLHALTMPLVDAVICVSESVWKSFGPLMRFLSRNKSYIIYNGIDPSRVQAIEVDVQRERERLGVRGGEFLIGTVGRLIPQKDQKTLINAVGQVTESHPHVKLVIVGAGKCERELKELAKSKGMEDIVHFTGRVERERVFRILHALDLFVMTSLWEGFSVAVLEAMAVGKPIILTDIPSFNEAIEDGISGIIVPVQDTNALANAITYVMDNPYRAKAMGLAAKERLEEKFSIDRTAREYEELYMRLLQECDRMKAEA